MGIQQDSRHKRRATGGKRATFRKHRKFLLGRQAAKTKLGETRVREVRVRGGSIKLRALRLDAGIFSWGSEGISRKSRIISVVYNGANNEYVRTNTLVKGEVVQIDAAPFRLWWESYYGIPLKKGGKVAAPKPTTKATKTATKGKKEVAKKDGDKTKTAAKAKEAPKAAATTATKTTLAARFRRRAAKRVIDPVFEEHLLSGRVLAVISSRPGQTGRVDGYLLEGKELEFYVKKTQKKKSGK